MKKLKFFIFGLFLFLIVPNAKAAYEEVYSLGQTSFTLTNETTVRISSLTMRGGLLLGVVIDSPSANGTLTLADAGISTAVPNIVLSTFAILSLAAGQTPGYPATYIPFNITLSSGLTYTTANNTGGVTIIYKSIFTGR